MAFILISGQPTVQTMPKTASTAIACNAVLEADGSGAVNPADAADVSLFGVSQQAITSSDSDYASNTPIGMIKLTDDLVFEADVETGTATAALVGTRCDLASSTGIDVTATSHNQVTIVGFISASKVLVQFNGSSLYRNAA